MSMIIIPQQHRADASPLAELDYDPVKKDQTVVQIMQCVAQSFRDDAVRDGVDRARSYRTTRERDRRVKILLRWYSWLRRNGYGHIQTMDEIPKALRAELDDGNYTPPERNRLWAPGGV